MSKKKIQALVLAGILTVSVVGGTFAWFTAQDSVKNLFNTAGTNEPGNLDTGIKIEENFPGPDGKPIKPNEDGSITYPVAITPNQTLIKEVHVNSTAKYEQIIKARVVKGFLKDGGVVTHYKLLDNGEVIYANKPTESGWQALNLAYIELEKDLNGIDAPDGWTIQTGANANTSALRESNWYFSNMRLQPVDKNGKTTDLLKTVTLSKEANNVYKNLGFDVKVEAESIQATNDAVNSWNNVPENIKALNINTSTN